MLGAGFTTTVAVGAALLLAPQAAFAAATVGPPIVQPGGNVTVFDNAAGYTANTAVQLSVGSCATKFATVAASGPWTATVGNRSGTSLGITVPTAAAGVVAGANGTLRTYNVCVYDAATSAGNLIGNSVVYVGAQPGASSMGGVTGGGGPLTVSSNPNSPLFTGVSTVAAVATTGSCNAVLGAGNPSNLVTSAVVKPSNNTSVTFTVPPGVVATSGGGGGGTVYNICLYDGSSPAGGLITFVPYTATVAGASPASGSYASSNGITVNSPMPFLSGVSTPAVLLIAGGPSCPGTYSVAPMGPVTPIPVTGVGSVRKLSNNRAAVTVPPLALNNGQPTPYQMCFYGSAQSGPLIGSSNYTAAVVANPTSVIPAAGPNNGGNTITVVGTDFPTDPGSITATLGGAPLTGIQSVSDKAFTAQAPAHSSGDSVTLVVTTPAGTKALPGAYTYLNPIKISPNTAPNTSPTVDVDVQGSGFMSINFGNGGTAGRVFLVPGVYSGADAGGGVRATPPVTECGNVLQVSDQELVCTLQLNRRLNSTGTALFDSVTYTNTITTDISTTAGSRVIGSASGKFSAGDVGQPIVQSQNTNIPAGTLVSAVLSPARAVISNPATSTSGSAFSATIGGNVPAHLLTSAVSTTAGSTTVTAGPGAFARADIGRVVNGATGIPNGTTITAVAPGGAGATLSAPATASTGYTLANVTTTDGSTTISSAAIAATDQSAVVGPNTIGIPVGTTISAVGTPGTSGTLSAAASGGGTTASLALNRPISVSLYAAAPVPEGAYQLVVVSDGAPDAATTDPDYFQTDATSGSVFTVAPF
jgi:hypothetical protein